MWLLLFFFSLLFFFFDSLSFSLPQMILPLEEALSFTLTSLQFQYYVRNDYFLNVIVRGRTQKSIVILFDSFLIFQSFSLRFIHPLVSSFHTFSFHIPHPPLWCKFQSHLRPFFPLLCTCLQKKKKYPFSSVVRSLSSSFLFRSSQFPLAPSPSPTLPHCFHGGWSKPPEVTRRTGEFRVNFYSNVTRTYTSLKKRGSDLGLLLYLFDKVY